MKTSILVILFLYCSQILSQIESQNKTNHRDFLKERKNHSTNPLKQRESSFEANMFPNNDSRRGVNKTALNNEFLLTEQIEQSWNSTGWVNMEIGDNFGMYTGGGRHTYLYNESNYMIEELVQEWENLNWVNGYRFTYNYDANNLIEYSYNIWKGSYWYNMLRISYTYTYDASNNMIEELIQGWDDSSWVDGEKNTYTYDVNNNIIEELEQRWDDSSWIDWSKQTYTYDANNNIIEDLWQGWKNSSWVNDRRSVFTYQSITTKIEQLTEVVEAYSLSNNYPNPFNPATTIRYSIPNQSNVTLKVFDGLGKEVKTLVNEEKPVGNYEIVFDASGLSSGVYFYTLRAGNYFSTKKMLMLR